MFPFIFPLSSSSKDMSRDRAPLRYAFTGGRSSNLDLAASMVSWEGPHGIILMSCSPVGFRLCVNAGDAVLRSFLSDAVTSFDGNVVTAMPPTSGNIITIRYTNRRILISPLLWFVRPGCLDRNFFDSTTVQVIGTTQQLARQESPALLKRSRDREK